MNVFFYNNVLKAVDKLLSNTYSLPEDQNMKLILPICQMLYMVVNYTIGSTLRKYFALQEELSIGQKYKNLSQKDGKLKSFQLDEEIQQL